MSGYFGKLPFAQNIASAMDFQNQSFDQQFGWELPCSVKSVSDDGLQVTVSFQVQASQYNLPDITIPVASSQYIRAPIQKGDTGVTKKVDVDLTYIAGLQDGVPNFATVGNLASVLFFQPLTTTKWPDNPNINAAWVYGPDGVILQDTDGNSIATINHDASKGITLVVGDNNVTVNSSKAVLAVGSNNVTVSSSGISINGTLKINGELYTMHEHSSGTYVAGTTPVTGVSGPKV
jgi:hypothetical protein